MNELSLMNKMARICYLALALVMAALMSACGDAATNDLIAGEDGSSPYISGTNTYRVDLTGDGIGYTITLLTDIGEATEEQVVTGGTVPVGGTASHTINGYAMGTFGASNSGVSRVSGLNVSNGGQWLVIKLYKNNQLIRTDQLSDNGTYTTYFSQY